MTKKLFSLLRGDQIRKAPKTKIIPAAEFSVLQNAIEILDTIKKEAEAYRVQVTQECEKLKEEGFKQGYEEGFKEWAEHLVFLEKQLEKLRHETQKSIIPIALTAAKKIVGREIALSEDTIVDIIATNLKAVSTHKKIVIYVNKKELELIEKNKKRLRDLFEQLENLSIRTREDVEPGGCIIETEIGIINNGKMEHRWRVLEKAFENMIKNGEKDQ